MLLHKYLPDCCDQCCDCEKVDPAKDRVLISTPLLPLEHMPEKPPMKEAVIGNQARQADLTIRQPIAGELKLKEVENARSIAEAVELADRRRRAAEEADRKRQLEAAEELELVKARELAEALEVQEVVEAQELLEAQEASLRELREVEDARRCEEEARDKEERLKEEREDLAKINQFLKVNGFADLDSKRKRFFKWFLPLHSAVSKNDSEMVQLLLAAGARPTLKNSSGLSPLQLAQKLDKNGSHSQVVKLLKFGAG